MKFIHLSDLHIGKRVNEFSMIEDQKYILLEILSIIEKEEANAVLISGDIYDKSQPSNEAVNLFDEFIFRLSKLNVKTYIISGNHDSAEKLSFAYRFIEKSNVFISPVYNGEIKKHTLLDEWGKVNIYMLPFIKPINVKLQFEDEEIGSYTDAIKVAIKHMDVNENERNIILSHQFVTGAIRSDSEEISLGGTDNVDVCAYDSFDYVALGHIHSPQKLVRDTVRYSGTPLKYSFSECRHNKSVTVVEMKEKGNVSITQIPLVPMRDMVEIKGKYDEVMAKSFYENLNADKDYFHITLTNEEDVADALLKLRTVYKNIMKLDYDNKRTRAAATVGTTASQSKSPLELFDELYEMQNGAKPSEEQEAVLLSLIKEIWEGEQCDR